ncbi:MAG: TolB family protein [Chloroflexia bacterium]
MTLKSRVRGWALPVLMLLLLVPLAWPAGAAPPAPPTPPAPSPDLGAEFLTYGADMIPDPKKPAERVRNFYSRTVAGGDERQLTTSAHAWYQNWAPDASAIAVVDEGLALSVMKPDGSDIRQLAAGVYSNPFWSPDGRFIAYLGGEGWTAKPLPRGDLWVIPSGGGPAWKVPGATDIPSLPAGVAWSPDGTRIAAGFPGHIFDLTRPDAPPAELPGDGRGMWVLGGGWSPDGRYMAVSDGNRFGVLTLASGHFTEVARANGAPGTVKAGASWAGGPRRVVFSVSSPGSEGHRVVAADFDGGNPLQIWSVPHVENPRRGEISSIGPPGVSPSGRQILIRVSRTTALGGALIFNHESWLLQLDGSSNKLLIPNSFNAVWRPKTRFPSASAAFYNTWRLSDNAVATGQAVRPWTWGPRPITSTLEAWSSAPGGKRLVEYYDKGRMEIGDPTLPRPSKYYVTSGLLVKEMVRGQIATGPDSFTPVNSADLPVVGDEANNHSPSYATFNTLGAATDAGKEANHTGEHVSTVLGADGKTSQDAGLGAGVVYAHFVPESGHNIPDAFWTWLQAQPDWVSLTGYPISEAYWVFAPVAGKPDQPILIQLFERRSLTFDLANPPALRIEPGNVGRQYWAWRSGQH